MPHTKAPRQPPSRPHSPAKKSMRWPAPASHGCTPECRTRPAGAAARLTIAPLDLHVNPDLDFAEVGRCHHLIWSSCGGPREGDGRAEKAGRGRGRCGWGCGCPRPRRPRRQRECEQGPRGAAAGRQAEIPGLQAGGRMRTPERRGEARAGAVKRRRREWEGPRRPPRADAGEAGRRAPAQSAPPASLPLLRTFPGCLQAAPPSSAAGGRWPKLVELRKQSARGPAPNQPASSLILARGRKEAGTRAPVSSCLWLPRISAVVGIGFRAFQVDHWAKGYNWKGRLLTAWAQSLI